MLFDLEGMEEVAIVGFRKPAGYWVVSDDFRIETRHKPGRFHRLMMRWLFGWRWEDV